MTAEPWSCNRSDHHGKPASLTSLGFQLQGTHVQVRACDVNKPSLATEFSISQGAAQGALRLLHLPAKPLESSRIGSAYCNRIKLTSVNAAGFFSHHAMQPQAQCDSRS